MGKKWTTQAQGPISLLRLVTLGVVSSLLVVGGLFLLFAAYEAEAWLFWAAEERLNQDTLFGVGRNAVTLAAAFGVGVTLFFSYRKQQTAERAQELAVQAQTMALETQKLATHTLQLSLDKHELERVSELRNRYARSAEQLANEKEAVQQAGIHSLAALADDWLEMGNEDEQQVCIALLCSYVSGATLSPPVSDQASKTVATDVIFSRMHSDVVNSHKSWSSKTLSLNTAHLAGWHGANFTGGKHTFTDCTWGMPGARGFKLIGGQLSIIGSLSNQHFPQSIRGEFAGGRAELALMSDQKHLVSFYRSKFTGSHVTLRVTSESRAILLFSFCEFLAGQLIMSHFDRSPTFIFRSCVFTPEHSIRLSGSYNLADFEFDDCIFMEDGDSTPYTTEDFLARARTTGPISRTPLTQQGTLF